MPWLPKPPAMAVMVPPAGFWLPGRTVPRGEARMES